jgi:hypothetical protein
LKEATEGKYYTPKNFRGQTGKGYQLKLTTPNGEVYESTIEKMLKVPPIQQVYDAFDQKAILNSTSVMDIVGILFMAKQSIFFRMLILMDKLLKVN